MMETGGRKILFYCFHPLIGMNLTTGIAEASFAGMRNDNVLIRVLRAGIFMITQLLGITAGEHLLYCTDDVRAKRIFVLA
jgi:hypothetical protein